jgi:hypothetical protein
MLLSSESDVITVTGITDTQHANSDISFVATSTEAVGAQYRRNPGEPL